MYELAENGDLEMVKFLVEHGADVNCDDGLPLMCSAEYGHLDIVKFLIEHGADIYIDKNNDIGISALQMSASHGHLEVVKFLVASGANIHTLNISDIKHLEVVEFIKSL
jgi:ankyrin repeat protein